jgi:Na+/melibiose symporter-like transporter
MGEVVSGDADRARAAGIGQATSSTAAIIGPPLAAPLLFTVGIQWALLFNAASYAVSYFAIRSVRLAPEATPVRDITRPRASVWQDFTAGLRYFGRNRFLVALLTIAVICQCGTGALSALNVFFVTRNLHASPHLYGFLGTALGLGGIAGALMAGRVVHWLGARTTTWLGLFLGGALLVAYSRQTVFLAALIVLFVALLPITMLNTAMSPLLLAATPREYMGRVIAVFNPVVELASMLSVVVAGWLASSALHGLSASVAGMHIGAIDTIFGVSGLLVMVAGVYAVIALPHQARQSAPATPAEAEAPAAS